MERVHSSAWEDHVRTLDRDRVLEAHDKLHALDRNEVHHTKAQAVVRQHELALDRRCRVCSRLQKIKQARQRPIRLIR